jgi:hypothetical protein
MGKPTLPEQLFQTPLGKQQIDRQGRFCGTEHTIRICKRSQHTQTQLAQTFIIYHTAIAE